MVVPCCDGAILWWYPVVVVPCCGGTLLWWYPVVVVPCCGHPLVAALQHIFANTKKFNQSHKKFNNPFLHGLIHNHKNYVCYP